MTEVARHVVRVRRSIEIRRMALVAVRVLQLVVSVDMTRLTLRSNVSPGQREPGRAMIECGVLPVRR